MTADPRSVLVKVVIVLAASLCLSGCAGDFTVRRADPLRTVEPATLADGVRAQRRGQTDIAAGNYLRVLEKAAAARTSGQAREEARFATARLVELCAPRLLADPSPLTFTAPGAPTRHYRVSLQPGAGSTGIEPSKFTRLEPVDRFAVSDVHEMNVRAGAGAALVGRLQPISPFRPDTTRSAQPVSDLHWPVTAIAKFGRASVATQSVALALYDPRDPALAADFTTPLAVSLSGQTGRNLWLTGFFRGDSNYVNAGLYPTEAPSLDRTPVVLVHGLLSDPGYFRYIVNSIKSDPELRRRYQVWVFFYPTGLPVPSSAALLRESLAKQVRQLDPAGRHPALHRIVLGGHSMGGLISRLMVSDSGGDTFYREYLRTPIDELQMSEKSRALLRQTFFFQASPDVRTVVFIATPHRGSDLALTFVGAIGRLAASLPRALNSQMTSFLARNHAALADPTARGDNSILGLNPHSTLVSALEKIPLRSDRVRLYSIIGNRGRTGPLENSSDGIVPYHSSHLPSAIRETIVPAGHSGALKDPATLAEIARILHETPAFSMPKP